MKKHCLIFFFYVVSASLVFSQKMEWALMDTKSYSPFNEGLACYSEWDGKSTLYGAIDHNGKIIIEPRFKHSFSFENGYALVVLPDNKKGFINRNGHYLLEPGDYKYISKAEESVGLYSIRSNNDSCGLFYNNRLVIPVIYKYVSTHYFPFISITPYENDVNPFYLNLYNGKIYNDVKGQGNLYWAKNEKEEILCDKDGTELDKNKFTVSSKGVTWFRDNKTGKIGFKNIHTEDIITPAIYEMKNHFPFFIYDVMILSYDDGDKQSIVLIDASGKEVIKHSLFQGIRIINEEFVTVSVGNDLERKEGLYSISGKELLPVEFYVITQFADDWLTLVISNNEDGIHDKWDFDYDYYHCKTQKRFSNYAYWEKPKEDMCVTAKKTSGGYRYGYINLKTFKEIPPKYSKAKDFSEGIAYVETDNSESCIIDKNGNIILRENEKFAPKGSASEGVIGAYDKTGSMYGYIYNPTKKSEYIYNQMTSISDRTVNSWIRSGNEEFKNGKYAIAKEYFYKAMMADPMNTEAIIAYGACLGNMGHYEEAIEVYYIALDIDPENELALSNLSLSQQSLLKQKQKEKIPVQTNNSASLWDALSSFGEVLVAIGGETSGVIDNNYTYNTRYTEKSSSSNSTCESFQRRYSDIKTKRDREANRNAQREGTATGKNKVHKIRTETGDADVTGGATSGDYKVINSSRSLIREYERLMENIKLQAQKEGCNVY